MHFGYLYTQGLALLLREELGVSDKSVWLYARDLKLQVYFDSRTPGETVDYQVAPEMQSKGIMLMAYFGDALFFK